MKRLSKHFRFLFPVLAAALVLSASGICVPVYAGWETEADPYVKPETFRSSDYSYYKNSDGTVTIDEYLGEEDIDLEIPSELDGYAVSTIGYQAFTYKDFESVIIPEGIQKISQRAFEYCEISEKLVFPPGITIERDAFSYADLPDLMSIPEGATVKKDSFAYVEDLEILSVESDAVIEEQAFSYSKSLKAVVCAAGSCLQNKSFEYSRKLEQVILCGDAVLEGDPFEYCNNVEIRSAQESEFAQLPTELKTAFDDQKDDVEDGFYTHTVEDMTITTPAHLLSTSQPGYDLFLMDLGFNYLVGASVNPPSILDFEKDEDIQKMLEIAKEYVDVKEVYKVRVCGYPSVWINIESPEDDSTGVYLYISAEDKMYYLMFLNLEESRELFVDMVNTITIDGQSEGTDISVVTD